MEQDCDIGPPVHAYCRDYAVEDAFCVADSIGEFLCVGRWCVAA